MDFLHRLLPPARWRTLCLALLIVGICLCFMAYTEDSPALQNGAYVVVALAVLGNFAFWRCPRCRKTLPMKDMMHIDRCPYCKADVKYYTGK